jgi:hypothetical protein
VKIDCGGSFPKEVYSRSRPSFILWLVMRVRDLLGRVCGGRRLLRDWLFCLVSGFGQNSDLG